MAQVGVTVRMPAWTGHAEDYWSLRGSVQGFHFEAQLLWPSYLETHISKGLGFRDS